MATLHEEEPTFIEQELKRALIHNELVHASYLLGRVDIDVNKPLSFTAHPKKRHALFVAISLNFVEMAKLLIESGENIDEYIPITLDRRI